MSNKKKIIIIITVVFAIIAVVFCVMRDWEAPTVSGITSGDKISVEFGEKLNIKNYVKENVSFSDNKSDVTFDITSTDNSEYYDSDSGEMNTRMPGDYSFKLIAKDETGNKTKIDFIITVKKLHFTKDNNTNVVIYDGDLGRVTVSLYKSYEGSNYSFVCYIENDPNTPGEMMADHGTAYINDEEIDSLYGANAIKPGKKGYSESFLDVSTLKGVKEVEVTMNVTITGSSGITTIEIPTIVDPDAFK